MLTLGKKKSKKRNWKHKNSDLLNRKK